MFWFDNLQSLSSTDPIVARVNIIVYVVLKPKPNYDDETPPHTKMNTHN